jgi:ABC-type transport system substrate-binding protein
MRYAKIIKVFALLVLVSVWMLPLGAARAADDKILHIIYNQDIRTSDPAIAYETETWPTASLFYIGLVKMKDASTPEGALAESWKISDDGTTYTFTLRDGIKFSNGRDITADDIKYSFTRLLDPKTASPTSFMFAPLVGVDDFQAGKATEVAGIKVIDKKTVEFKTATPVWSMMQRFALPPGFIVAPHRVFNAKLNFETIETRLPFFKIVGILCAFDHDAALPTVDHKRASTKRFATKVFATSLDTFWGTQDRKWRS